MCVIICFHLISKVQKTTLISFQEECLQIGLRFPLNYLFYYLSVLFFNLNTFGQFKDNVLILVTSSYHLLFHLEFVIDR